MVPYCSRGLDGAMLSGSAQSTPWRYFFVRASALSEAGLRPDSFPVWAGVAFRASWHVPDYFLGESPPTWSRERRATLRRVPRPYQRISIVLRVLANGELVTIFRTGTAESTTPNIILLFYGFHLIPVRGTIRPQEKPAYSFGVAKNLKRKSMSDKYGHFFEATVQLV